MQTQKRYAIQVEGRLDDTWSSMFDNMDLSVSITGGGTTVTTLSGPLVDETQLFGLLNRIRDLGIHLLLVCRLEPYNEEGP